MRLVRGTLLLVMIDGELGVWQVSHRMHVEELHIGYYFSSMY
jgi:hypothetical protein